MITSYLSSFCVLLGIFFVCLAAIGIVRMPDLFCRIHVATKAGSFGVSLTLLGLFFHIPTLRVGIQSLLIVFFFYLTAPIAAQMISRVGILQKLPTWGIDKQKKN